jgi:hypothetical protein
MVTKTVFVSKDYWDIQPMPMWRYTVPRNVLWGKSRYRVSFPKIKTVKGK